MYNHLRLFFVTPMTLALALAFYLRFNLEKDSQLAWKTSYRSELPKFIVFCSNSKRIQCYLSAISRTKTPKKFNRMFSMFKLRTAPSLTRKKLQNLMGRSFKGRSENDEEVVLKWGEIRNPPQCFVRKRLGPSHTSLIWSTFRSWTCCTHHFVFGFAARVMSLQKVVYFGWNF